MSQNIVIVVNECMKTEVVGDRVSLHGANMYQITNDEYMNDK